MISAVNYKFRDELRLLWVGLYDPAASAFTVEDWHGFISACAYEALENLPVLRIPVCISPVKSDCFRQLEQFRTLLVEARTERNRIAAAQANQTEPAAPARSSWGYNGTTKPVKSRSGAAEPEPGQTTRGSRTAAR